MKPVFALLSATVLILAISCSKNGITTKPRIVIKDYTATVLPGGSLVISMDYFDKEGDLDSIFGNKMRFNTDPEILPNQYLADTFNYPLMVQTAKNQGEIAFQLEYSLLNEQPVFNDTIKFKFYVKDRAGNVSDTIITNQIVAINE
ncbi:MAG TPA: hypothetical protein PKC69_08905 [Chitinophagaceae bacterium]|nr:hypothetical protein [Chitinophagaceae bacterium]